jgi:virulence-associated protein VagC
MLHRESSALQQGKSTTVTLPADWVRANGVRVKDRLLITYDDESVTVRPKKGSRS